MGLIWRVVARVAAIGLVALLASCGGGNGQLSGTITGLTSNGLVLSDGTDSLTITSGSASFTFPTLLADGTTYTVAVTTQPTGLYCTVANGSGTVSSSTPSAAITVTCAANFNLSGSITGLTGSGLELNDQLESISVPALAPSFAFPTLLTDQTTYTVTITAQPTGQTCKFTSTATSTTTVTPNGGPVSVAITC